MLVFVSGAVDGGGGGCGLRSGCVGGGCGMRSGCCGGGLHRRSMLPSLENEERAETGMLACATCSKLRAEIADGGGLGRRRGGRAGPRPVTLERLRSLKVVSQTAPLLSPLRIDAVAYGIVYEKGTGRRGS